MSLRDIVVFLDASPASEERLRLATCVAREHGAYLSAVFAHHEQTVDVAVGLAARHGMATQLVPSAAGTRRSATPISADLIVAGAYHHSPLREALIGGVSRELLLHMTVPVLMSH
jgi:nucleotide-binding universal stress UspA family protein